MPPKTKRYRVGLIFIYVLYIAGLVAAAEAVVAYFLPAPQFSRISVFSYGSDYILSSNPSLIYQPKPNTREFNGYGHRGKEYPFKKTGARRIVFMGDSVIYGHDVQVKDRLTDRLNEKLGPGWEVINLGVKGYNLVQEVEYLKFLGLRFSPDYVFFGFTYNDLGMNDVYSGEVENFTRLIKTMPHSGFYTDYYTAKSRVEEVLFRSNLYRYYKYFFAGSSGKTFSDAVSYTLKDDEADRLIKELAALSRKYGFRLALVSLPINVNVPPEQLRKIESLAAANGVDSINLDLQFTNPAYKQSLFFPNDPCHLTAVGHEAVAEALFQRGVTSGLFDTAKP